MKSIHASRQGSGAKAHVSGLKLGATEQLHPRQQGSGASAYSPSAMKSMSQPSKRQQGSGANARVPD